MAMGGAGVGLADDEYALFQNPAGLAGQDTRQLRVLGLGLEGSLDTYTTFTTSYNAVKKLDLTALNLLMGKDIYMRANDVTMVQLPRFSLAYILDFKGGITEYNQANPYLHLTDQTTQGLQAGTGWKLDGGRHSHDEWRIGVAAKLLWRKGGVYDISTAGLLQATGQGKAYLDQLTGNYGMGIGADAGVQYVRHIDKDTDLSAGSSLTDVGNTRFSSPQAAQIPMNWSLGVGYKKNFHFMKIALGADLKNLTDGVVLANKTHFGAEVKIPLFSFYLGANQLAPSYGVSVDLWLVRVSLMSYQEQLGIFYGQDTSRRYLLQIDLNLPI